MDLWNSRNSYWKGFLRVQLDNTFEDQLKQTWYFLIIALPAMFGGLVHFLRTHKTFSWKTLIIELLTSLFTGYIMASLLDATSFSQGVRGAIISLSGYTSVRTLETISDIFINKVGDIVDERK